MYNLNIDHSNNFNPLEQCIIWYGFKKTNFEFESNENRSKEIYWKWNYIHNISKITLRDFSNI